MPRKAGKCLLSHQGMCLGSLFSWLVVGGVGYRRSQDSFPLRGPTGRCGLRSPGRFRPQARGSCTQVRERLRDLPLGPASSGDLSLPWPCWAPVTVPSVPGADLRARGVLEPSGDEQPEGGAALLHGAGYEAGGLAALGGGGTLCLMCCPPVSLGSIQPRPGWAAAPSVRPPWPPGLACLGGADSQQGAEDSSLQTVL